MDNTSPRKRTVDNIQENTNFLLCNDVHLMVLINNKLYGDTFQKYIYPFGFVMYTEQVL